jgi:hypothetical protein
MPKVDNFRVSDFARPIANEVVNGTGIQGNTQTKRLSYSSKLFATNTATPSQTPSRMRIIRVTSHRKRFSTRRSDSRRSTTDRKGDQSRLQTAAEHSGVHATKDRSRVRAKLTDEFLANFLLGNDDDEDDAELLRFGAGGSVELSDGWQETLNSAIDREIDAAKRIAFLTERICPAIKRRLAAYWAKVAELLADTPRAASIHSPIVATLEEASR